MQFEFMPGHTAIVSIFFLSQQQEKYHGEIGYINFVFIDFEKFFDHVLRKVTFRPWGNVALRKQLCMWCRLENQD